MTLFVWSRQMAVAGFQAAFLVNKLLEIVDEQKKAVAAHEKTESASTTPIPPENTTVGFYELCMNTDT